MVRLSLAYPEVADQFSDAVVIAVQRERRLVGDRVPPAWKHGDFDSPEDPDIRHLTDCQNQEPKP